MIPDIGILVAAYAIVRLIQIPIEHSQVKGKTGLLTFLSLVGIVIVGFCAIDLIMSGTRTSPLGDLGR